MACGTSPPKCDADNLAGNAWLGMFFLLPGHAADTGLGGGYAGAWKSSGADGSSFQMSLDLRPEGTRRCEVSFTFDGLSDHSRKWRHRAAEERRPVDGQARSKASLTYFKI